VTRLKLRVKCSEASACPTAAVLRITATVQSLYGKIVTEVKLQNRVFPSFTTRSHIYSYIDTKDFEEFAASFCKVIQ